MATASVRVVLVRAASRRHPHQVLIASMCVLSGLPVLAGADPPNSIAAAVPGWLAYVWAGTLCGCGGLIVAAAAVRSELNAIYLELTADLPMAAMCAVYAAALLLFAGWRGMALAPLVAGAGLAFGVRWWQVGRELRLRRSFYAGGQA